MLCLLRWCAAWRDGWALSACCRPAEPPLGRACALRANSSLLAFQTMQIVFASTGAGCARPASAGKRRDAGRPRAVATTGLEISIEKGGRLGKSLWRRGHQQARRLTGHASRAPFCVPASCPHGLWAFSGSDYHWQNHGTPQKALALSCSHHAGSAHPSRHQTARQCRCCGL